MRGVWGVLASSTVSSVPISSPYRAKYLLARFMSHALAAANKTEFNKIKSSDMCCFDKYSSTTGSTCFVDGVKNRENLVERK